MKTWTRCLVAALFCMMAGYLFTRGAWVFAFGGAAFVFAAVSLFQDPDKTSPDKKPNFLQESDGSWSMRRISAAFLFISGVSFFFMAAKNDHQYAFYSGLACEGGGAIMLFFTTWNDLAQLALAIKGKTEKAKPDGSTPV